MKSVLMFSALLFASNAFAVLPPYWDSAKQIETVINSAEVSAQLFGSIDSVTRISDLTYKVKTADCAVTVELEAQFSKTMVGPTTYSVKDIRAQFCK